MAVAILIVAFRSVDISFMISFKTWKPILKIVNASLIVVGDVFCANDRRL